MDLLEDVLTAPITVTQLDELGDESISTFDDAAWLAARSDRLAWVFAAAYQGALARVFGAECRAALCVTEDAGNVPRAIGTRFAAGRLHGTKSFVTFGAQAEQLLVLASRGEVDGRKDLVIAATGPDEVRFVESLHTPFMPEISHARVVFEGSAAEVVHEDAWPLVKAFRFVEDAYVLGATLAWLAALAARHAQLAAAGELAGLLLATRELASGDPAAAARHIAYDGISRQASQTFDRFDWREVDPQIADRWERDRPVLDVAATARAARLAAAERSIRGER